MNTDIVRIMVGKDWQFHRKATLLGCLTGVVALSMLTVANQAMFYAGSVLLLSVIITLGIYLPIVTVVQERTEGMLPFVMSLPMAVPEYTLSKLLSNMLLFMTAWLLLAAGALVMIMKVDSIPDGMLPFTSIIMVHMATAFVLVLATSLVSESMEWTIAVGGGLNLVFQGFLYWVSHIPDIAAAMPGAEVVWTRSAALIVIVELAVIALVLMATWRVQGRKTDFA